MTSPQVSALVSVRGRVVRELPSPDRVTCGSTPDSPSDLAVWPALVSSSLHEPTVSDGPLTGQVRAAASRVDSPEAVR